MQNKFGLCYFYFLSNHHFIDVMEKIARWPVLFKLEQDFQEATSFPTTMTCKSTISLYKVLSFTQILFLFLLIYRKSNIAMQLHKYLIPLTVYAAYTILLTLRQKVQANLCNAFVYYVGEFW